MKFAKFMAGNMGRGLRIAAGLVLVYLGFFIIGRTGGYILGVVGLAPLFAGIFDVCLLAPLFGAPFLGKAVRNS